MAEATIPMTIYVDEETKTALDSMKREGFSLTGFVRAAISEKLARHRPEVPILATDIARS